MGNFLRCMFFDKTLSLNEHNAKSLIYASNEIDNIVHIQIKLLLQTNINLWMRILKSISHFFRKAMLLIVEKKRYRKLNNIRFVCVIEEKE